MLVLVLAGSGVQSGAETMHFKRRYGAHRQEAAMSSGKSQAASRGVRHDLDLRRRRDHRSVRCARSKKPRGTWTRGATPRFAITIGDRAGSVEKSAIPSIGGIVRLACSPP
jgi:hypothetical protein